MRINCLLTRRDQTVLSNRLCEHNNVLFSHSLYIGSFWIYAQYSSITGSSLAYSSVHFFFATELFLSPKILTDFQNRLKKRRYGGYSTHRDVCIITKPARHDRKINTADLYNHFHWQIVHMTVSRKLPSQLMSVEFSLFSNTR
jgi:hypothetical protein